ncbi:DMT family transporter [Aureimonas pseudogalii]|uniref:DMT family transporter n=1 Tax=Aureimonas pseudogalii TaxID=1744844 RepID=UPI0016060B8E|nr:DMT family transporter [Aureimonas pseudogalii]
MSPLDLITLIGICFIWAVNVVVGRIVIADLGTPPLLYAFLRFAVVAILLHRFLVPIPRPFGRMVAVGGLMGAGHFGLLFLGLQYASPSTAAIVVQFGIPATAVLSVWLLKERMSRRRVLGTAIAFAGVITVMWTPGGLVPSLGASFVLASAFALSLGSVLMKGMPRIAPLQLQAWVSLISLLPLAIISGLTEAAPVTHIANGGWPVAAAIAFSAVVVTIVAHTGYYRLLQLYDVNLVAPLTLLMPIMTVGLGIVFTGDQVDIKMLAGSVLALGGVAVILSPSRGTLQRRLAAVSKPTKG